MNNIKHTFELKYIIQNSRSSQVLSWLKNKCLPDPEFPQATVSSIYYDTKDLNLLQEKINSYYLKTKVRLRWYSDLLYNEHFDESFIEAKFKIGSKRHKIRKQTSYSGSYLFSKNLESEELITVPYLLHEENFHSPMILFPSMQISYKRFRFIEPFTRSRICFDYDISCPRVNSMMRLKQNSMPIQTAVFEIKGDEPELPATLYSLINLGFTKYSFSKYFACYRHLMRTNY